jgi:Xaa-Pro aminopeptidase
VDLLQYNTRFERVRALMHMHGLDFLLIGPSADLVYLTGAHLRTTERMAVLVLPQEGPATVVLPAFEAPLLPPLSDGVQVRTWDESDNPARIAATVMSDSMHGHPGGVNITVGVGERLWSVFLLRLQAELPRAAFTPATMVMSQARQIKTSDEIDLLAHSGAMADEVFARIIGWPFSGRREIDMAGEIAALLEAGGLLVEGVPIVASGPNSASPHHHAGERVIRTGDVVVLDFGGTYKGYYSDITRTVFVGGRPADDSEEMRVYQLVAATQSAAVEAALPEMQCQELDSVARNLLTSAGYGEYFNHRLGHGIGLDGHEPPYLVQGNDTRLQPGMAFTIEPGLYLPGRFGVRIEDTVALQAEGAVRLNNADRGITIVE